MKKNVNEFEKKYPIKILTPKFKRHKIEKHRLKKVIIILFRWLPKKNKINKNVKDIKIKKKLKIGVVGVRHEINIGNNLIKYAISKILNEYGYIPYIIGTCYKNLSIDFLLRKTNLVVIKNNFSQEIKENDYDILMVNSDQTWRRFDKHFLDYGFLRFAKNWNKTKFVYAASLGFDYWDFKPQEDMIIRDLLKDFTGISVREKGSIRLIQRHLGITPEFVLDPTLFFFYSQK